MLETIFTRRALKWHSRDTQRALEDSEGTWRVLGYSQALENLRHSGTRRALKALGHSKGTWTLKCLGTQALKTIYLADSDLFFWDLFLTNPDSLLCKCNDSPFANGHHKHIVTGDLRTTKNNVFHENKTFN